MLVLIDIIGWIIAIAAIVGGIIGTIVTFTEGGGKIILGIVSLVIGVFVFIAVYNWLESIGLCLFASGGIMCLICTGGDDKAYSSAPKEPGVISKVADAATEYYVIESAAEEAIRKSKE